MYKKFFVYIDDGDAVYRIAIAAACEDSARIQCEGNGDVIAVRDVTDDHPIDIDRVSRVLKNGGFSDCERDFMVRLLAEFGIAE